MIGLPRSRRGDATDGVPLAAWLLLASLTLASAVGIQQLQFDDDYKLIFRSDRAGFDRYLEFLARFPGEETTVTAVVLGDFASATGIAALIDAETALYADPSVTAVESILDDPRLRTAIESDQAPAPAALLERLPRPLGALLSPDRTSTLLLATLGEAARSDSDLLAETLAGIRARLDHALAPHGMQARVGGIPAVRVALRQQVKHDQAMFNGLAALFATLVAWTLFRSPRMLVALAVGPALGVIWTLGAIGLMGLKINVLTQMVASLVLVVGYTDAVHLGRHAARARAAGASVAAAAREAIRAAGPACLATSLTTAAGFASLGLSDSWLVREFGLVCALGAILVFAAAMLATPVMALLIPAGRGVPEPGLPGPVRNWLVRLARHDRSVVVAGVALSAVTVMVALQVEPDYRFRENLPRDHEVRTAFDLGDRGFGGLLPLHVVLEWPGQAAPGGDQLLAALGRARARLEATTGIDWYSLADLVAALPPGVDAAQLPRTTTARFLDPESRQVVLSANVPDQGSRAAAPLLAATREAAAIISGELAPATAEVTGIVAVATDGSRSMIGDLGRSLAGAAAVIFGVILVLLRSWRLALISALPNIAPIAAVAAALVLAGEPLRYPSVLVFTICLGLAVDDTVHFIHAFRRRRAGGDGPEAAVGAALEDVGGVLVVTTGILLAGFGALALSSTPTVVTMGLLSCLALATALVVDLTLLPALLRRFSGDAGYGPS